MVAAPARSELVRRYGSIAEQKWQLLERHLELGSGFALVILLIPDSEAANLCKLAFGALLPPQQPLREFIVEVPDLLHELPEKLVGLHFGQDEGAVWVSGVPRQQLYDEAGWMAGWRHAVARMNESRDVLRRQLGGPLVLCGPPWLGPLLRETAPDLWSVRTLVVPIPAPLPPTERSTTARPVDAVAVAIPGPVRTPLRPALRERMTSILDSPFAYIPIPSNLQHLRTHPEVLRTPYALTQMQRAGAPLDPESALTSASSLRHHPAGKAQLCDLLLDAAYGFAVRRNGKEVARLTREIGSLLTGESPPAALHKNVAIVSQVLALTAWSELLQGDCAQARRYAWHSITAARAGAHIAMDREAFQSCLLLAHEVWAKAVVQLGILEEIDVALDGLAALLADDKDQSINIHLSLLRGLAERAHGRLAEAEAYFRRAQSQQDQMDAGSTDCALTAILLADSLLLQHRADEARQVLRLALEKMDLVVDSEEPVRTGERAWLHGMLFVLSAQDRDVPTAHFHASAMAALLKAMSLVVNPVLWLAGSTVLTGSLALMFLGRDVEAKNILQQLLEQQRTQAAPVSEKEDTVSLLTTAMLMAGDAKETRAFLNELKARSAGRAGVEPKLSPAQQQLWKLLSLTRMWPLEVGIAHLLRWAARRAMRSILPST